MEAKKKRNKKTWFKYFRIFSQEMVSVSWTEWFLIMIFSIYVYTFSKFNAASKSRDHDRSECLTENTKYIKKKKLLR